MRIILTGVGVSSGICIGDAIIINKDNINYSPSYIRKSQVKDEIKKFENALSRLRKEYQKSINKIKNNQAIIKLMDMQLTFVNDNSFKNKNILNLKKIKIFRLKNLYQRKPLNKFNNLNFIKDEDISCIFFKWNYFKTGVYMYMYMYMSSYI